MAETAEALGPYIAPLQRLQLSIEDAAAALCLPVSTLEVEVRRGKGPLFFKVGRRLYTTPELIGEWQAKKIAEARREASHHYEQGRGGVSELSPAAFPHVAIERAADALAEALAAGNASATHAAVARWRQELDAEQRLQLLVAAIAAQPPAVVRALFQERARG